VWKGHVIQSQIIHSSRYTLYINSRVPFYAKNHRFHTACIKTWREAPFVCAISQSQSESPKPARENRQSTSRACREQCHGLLRRWLPRCSLRWETPVYSVSKRNRSSRVGRGERTRRTSKYPKVQLVKIIPIVTLIFAEPKMCPTTVGIIEKKPPTATPATITKTISTPRVLAKGQIRNMVVPSNDIDIKATFTEPILSLKNPEEMRPTAEAALNAATSPAPVLEERPMDSANVGMQ
jgi:hypothetical protein